MLFGTEGLQDQVGQKLQSTGNRIVFAGGLGANRVENRRDQVEVSEMEKILGDITGIWVHFEVRWNSSAMETPWNLQDPKLLVMVDIEPEQTNHLL